jgi:hypothetical protein
MLKRNIIVHITQFKNPPIQFTLIVPGAEHIKTKKKKKQPEWRWWPGEMAQHLFQRS